MTESETAGTPQVRNELRVLRVFLLRPLPPHPEPPSATPPHRTGPPEAIGYAVAALILVGGGALFTTPILNWLAGPAICVLCVAAAGRLADRRRDAS